jgi:hypothetical protein
MGPPLARGEGSVFQWRRYVCCTIVTEFCLVNCWWSSPAQLFLVSRPVRLMTILYSLIFVTPRPGDQVPLLISPRDRMSSYTPRHRVPCLRLLRLAGVRWKYSNPPPHGEEHEFVLNIMYVFSSYLTGSTCYSTIIKVTGECCLRKLLLFIFIVIWNILVQSVVKMQSLITLKLVIIVVITVLYTDQLTGEKTNRVHATNTKLLLTTGILKYMHVNTM